RGCVAQRKDYALLGKRSALIGVETLGIIQKHLPLGTLRDALADIVEAVGGVRVENIETAADDGLAILGWRPREVQARPDAVFVGRGHVGVIWKFLVAPIHHLAGETVG